MKTPLILLSALLIVTLVLSGVVKHAGPVDITGKIFTDRSPDCRNYDGSFFAEVTDLYHGDGKFETVHLEISSTGTRCYFNTDGLPNHNYNNDDKDESFSASRNLNSRRFIVVGNPVFLGPPREGTLTTLNHEHFDGILLNGALLDLTAAACWKNVAPSGAPPLYEKVLIDCPDDHPWLLDPLHPDNAMKLDHHNAHAQPMPGGSAGIYHYHADPKAVYDRHARLKPPAESGVIGFAADGFPIYGPYIRDDHTASGLRKVQSSYRLKRTFYGKNNRVGSLKPRPSTIREPDSPGGRHNGEYIADYEYVEGWGDLDTCNGMVRDGRYGYYVTETYPYILGCHTGTVHHSFEK